MKLKHLIFDLDGTLIDTEGPVIGAWQLALREYGYEFTKKELLIAMGVPTEEGLRLLNVQVDGHWSERWKRQYRPLVADAGFFPGVSETMDALRTQGFQLGIVTSRNRDEYTEFFGKFRLEERFPTVILEEDTEKHKPDPEPLYRYLERTGARAAECVYVGDQPTDVQCANRAGILSGLALWNRPELSCSEAAVRFRTPEELPAFALKRS